jgi:uncharacterized membrane protein
MMSVELMLTTVVFLLVLSGIIGIVQERSETAYSTQEAAEARIIAEKVAQSLEDAYSGRDGHEIIVEMPPEIKGQDYRVKINSSGVFVDIGNRKCFSTSSVTRVTGPKHTEEEIFLYPRESYRITHQRDEDGNHFLVIGEMV